MYTEEKSVVRVFCCTRYFDGLEYVRKREYRIPKGTILIEAAVPFLNVKNNAFSQQLHN